MSPWTRLVDARLCMRSVVHTSGHPSLQRSICTVLVTSNVTPVPFGSWRDCMKQRISEMETRSKYLVHWIELPSKPRGLLCLDFDRTLLKVACAAMTQGMISLC